VQQEAGRGDRDAGSDECLVRLWRGYMTGEFQAFRPPSVEPFLCSPSFRVWHPPWRPKVRIEQDPAATAALQALTAELARRGWRSAGGSDSLWERIFVRDLPSQKPPKELGPAGLAETLLLRVLDLVAGEDGATAAEVGQALYGDEAASVPQLPQRIGARLRRLQLEGKVDRREQNGVSRWFPAS
jgi:hypothetical protein